MSFPCVIRDQRLAGPGWHIRRNSQSSTDSTRRLVRASAKRLIAQADGIVQLIVCLVYEDMEPGKLSLQRCWHICGRIATELGMVRHNRCLSKSEQGDRNESFEQLRDVNSGFLFRNRSVGCQVILFLRLQFRICLCAFENAVMNWHSSHR
jgi:hypothetical protein